MSTPAAVVTFDPAAFQAAFPAFANLSAATLQNYFNLAQLYVNNTAASVVQNPTILASLLNFVTAHLAFLMQRASAGDGSNAASVGQMTSAAQGTVSAAFAPIQAQNAQFWAQSEYGLLFWQACLPYRTMRYFPGTYCGR